MNTIYIYYIFYRSSRVYRLQFLGQFLRDILSGVNYKLHIIYYIHYEKPRSFFQWPFIRAANGSYVRVRQVNKSCDRKNYFVNNDLFKNLQINIYLKLKMCRFYLLSIGSLQYEDTLSVTFYSSGQWQLCKSDQVLFMEASSGE